MKIPKNTDIRVDTSNELIELHIVAAITTKEQADELSAAITAFAGVLEGEQRPKRRRKPRGEIRSVDTAETTEAA
jgi:hypothetical protein